MYHHLLFVHLQLFPNYHQLLHKYGYQGTEISVVNMELHNLYTYISTYNRISPLDSPLGLPCDIVLVPICVLLIDVTNTVACTLSDVMLSNI